MDRSFSAEELKQYDGKEGRPAYIAYKGMVYDVTDSKFWKGGVHAKQHHAGEDLTVFLEKAPHSEEVFETFPIIGKLIPKTVQTSENVPNKTVLNTLQSWNRSFHPHPISVHFPIALHVFSAFFNVVFLIDPGELYEFAVFSSFVAATVMGLFALLAGVFSWGVKYGFVRSKPFMIKLYGAVMTLVLGIVPIIQRIEDPMVAYSMGWDGFMYHFIIFVTVLTVSIVAYYGGKITWGGR